MSVDDTLRHMEMVRLQHQQEDAERLSEQDESDRLKSTQAYFEVAEQQPTSGQSLLAAMNNTPITRTINNWLATKDVPDDPNFSARHASMEVREELGSETAEKLWGAGSREEFDILLRDFRDQKRMDTIATTTALGNVGKFVSNEMSAENLLFSAATLGVSRFGTVAKAANMGVLSNTIKAGTAGAVSSYVGAEMDAANNIGFSHEDSMMAAFLGAGFGAGIGGLTGKVYKPKPKGSLRLYSEGGAVLAAAKALVQRATGKTYKEYERFHKAKNKFETDFRDSIERNESAIYKEDIDDMPFENINDSKLFEQDLKDWHERNQIDTRRASKKTLETQFDRFTPLKSEYVKFSESPSPSARVLGSMLYESGTGHMVKNNSAAIEMERLQSYFSDRYSPIYREHFAAYQAERAAKGGYGRIGKMRNFFKDRAAYNEELYLYMSARHNGQLIEASETIRKHADKLDETNELIARYANDANVEGYRDFTPRKGWIHQRHERSYYAAAVAKFGVEVVQEVVKKAIMSQYGSAIRDEKKAKQISQAFVNRFAFEPADRAASSVMDDDAWQVMQNIFEDHGIDFDGDDIKEVFKDKVRTKQDDRGKVRYAKQRMPMDMNVSHNGLRMIDLVNTDIENLSASYATSMGGQIALARKGLGQKSVRDNLSKRILKEDPNMSQSLDDLWQTFETGRTAGGVKNRGAAAAMKATVLSLLNNMWATQLTESGTGAATYGISKFFNSGTAAMKDMFHGRKTTASSALAKEITEHWFPMARDHVMSPQYLSQELQATSTLSTASTMDKIDAALNMGLHVQGYTSGFNVVRSAQHLATYEGLVHKIGRYAAEGKQLDTQLARLGMSEQLYDNITNMVKKHGVYKDNGDVELLNMTKWDLDTQEAFANLVVRNQSNIVQKAIAGEGSAWMSKDFGALLTQLRRFPLESVRKQLIRKQNIGNTHLAQSAAYNTLLAGTVITAANALKGNNTEKDLTNALRFGITYNADLGSVASVWDLGISLSGARDALHINPWARYSDGLLAVPALEVLNAHSKLPLGWVDMEMDTDEKRALKMLPIFGNHVAVNSLLNIGD